MMTFLTNLQLAEEGLEDYHSKQEMEEGSALAQVIAPIEGVIGLQIDGMNLNIWRDVYVPWHLIVFETTVALKELII